MESEMRILARKTKDILSRYRALQVKFRDLEREKDVTIETERKARKKAENEFCLSLPRVGIIMFIIPS